MLVLAANNQLCAMDNVHVDWDIGTLLNEEATVQYATSK